MPKPFKKRITGYFTPDGKKCSKVDATTLVNGTKVLKPGYERRKSQSSNYYGKVRLPDGKVKAVPLCTDKASSREMLARLITEVKLGQFGLITPATAAAGMPLWCQVCSSLGTKQDGSACRCVNHLSDFRLYLKAKADTEDHIKLTVSRIAFLLGGCQFVSATAIESGKVMQYLANRRAVPSDRGGLSTATSNHYLRAAKSFTAWMAREDRVPKDPLKHLQLLNAAADRRRERRMMETAELGRLLVATATSLTSFRGLSGMDRYVLYTLAAYTGLRASELASLTPRSFNLVGSSPTVTLAAAYSKRRRQDILPLHADVAKLLTEHLNGKPLDAPVWSGTWKKHASAKMIRKDLGQARTAWINEVVGPERQLREQSDRLKYCDAEGKFFDFHAFRGQFISDLCRLGVHPKKIQQLARHGNINLTMQVYAHVSKSELMESVAILPPPPLANPPKPEE